MFRFKDYYCRKLYQAYLPDFPAKPAALTLPIFRCRDHLVVEASTASIKLRFLNNEREFNYPISWHLAELAEGTRLWKLNLHYMEFAECLEDTLFAKVVSDWIKHNSPYERGYWLDSWNSYSLSIRCVVWMQQISARCENLGSEFRESTYVSLFRQLRFLRSNLELDIGGNHLVKNIKAMLYGGVFFECAEAKEWYSKGLELLNSTLDQQILADGMHFERSPAYHSQVFADLIECRVILSKGSSIEKLDRALTSMAQVLVDTTHPDGYVSLFNDGGLNMSYPPHELLSVFSTLMKFDLEPRQKFYMSEAGYIGSRYDDEYFLFDCGIIAPDCLPAHGHGDVFSFEWTIAGKRFAIDPGVYEYNAGVRRKHSRSTSSHNTVTLEGRDQAEFWGAFRVGRRPRVSNISFEETKEGFIAYGEHDGFSNHSERVVHSREIKYSRGSLEVVDSVVGGAGQVAEARILFHPHWKIVMDKSKATISNDYVELELSSENSISLIKTPWFSDFGVEEITEQLVINYGPAPVVGNGFSIKRIR